ncbi:MAG: hypothetical protein V7K50_27625 [Nostoc sp.]|uniref:hypothetical protein n=1 Tax=Nostoc sp. TaxID=1180 RepID=UPI002FF57BA7
MPVIFVILRLIENAVYEEIFCLGNKKYQILIAESGMRYWASLAYEEIITRKKKGKPRQLLKWSYIVELKQGSELFDTLVPDGGAWAPLITYLKEIARQHSEGNFPS